MIHYSVRALTCEPNVCVSWYTSEIRVRLVTSSINSSPLLLLLAVSRLCFLCGSFYYLFCVLCLCIYCLVCSLQSCGHLLGKDWPLGYLVCDVYLCFVTFTYDVLGQVWYLIVSIPDSYLLLYFYMWLKKFCFEYILKISVKYFLQTTVLVNVKRMQMIINIPFSINI